MNRQNRAVLACTVAAIAWATTCHADNKPKTANDGPNSGYVADAVGARAIAEFVLSRMLTARDLKHKTIFDVTLEGDVWTVNCREVKTRISVPIVIQIRQKTGAIIRYEDGNA